MAKTTKRRAQTKAIVAMTPEQVANALAVNTGALITQAVKQGLPVETLERLLNMRRDLKAEWAKEQYYKALKAFQADCPPIRKTKAVYNKADKGGDVRYTFAPFEHIIKVVHPYLEQYGFTYTFGTKQTENTGTAICQVHHVDGHSETTELTIPIDKDAYMSAPQRVQSAMTFAKRQSFINAFGLVTADGDDDAGSADAPSSEPDGQVAPQRKKPEPASKINLSDTLDEILKLLKMGPYVKEAKLAYNLEQRAVQLHKEKNPEALRALRDSIKTRVYGKSR